MATAVITENTSGGTHTGLADTKIYSIAPTTNYSTIGYTYAVSWDTGDYDHSVYRITPPSHGGSITITAARFKLYKEFAGDGAAYDVALHKCLRIPVITEATWNVYSTGNSWATAGALDSTDKDLTPLVTLSVDNSAPSAYYEWAGSSLATYVQTQVNASADICLILNPAPYDMHGNRTRRFYSAEGTDGLRPILEYDYTLDDNDIDETIDVEGTVTAAGQTVDAIVDIYVDSGVVTVAGQDISYSTNADLTASIDVEGAVTVAGETFTYTLGISITNGVVTVQGQTLVPDGHTVLAVPAVGPYRRVYIVSPSGRAKWVGYLPVTYITPPANKQGTWDDEGALEVVTLTDVTGLVEWVDYLPVVEVSGIRKNSYDDSGFLAFVEVIES